MRTDVSKSSLESYDALKASGMAESYAAILGFMKHGVIYTRKEIARALKLETSSVAGRVNELIDEEKIEVAGRKVCPISNRNVEAIMLTSDQRQLFK